jgi:hypothetical protein
MKNRNPKVRAKGKKYVLLFNNSASFIFNIRSTNKKSTAIAPT